MSQSHPAVVSCSLGAPGGQVHSRDRREARRVVLWGSTPVGEQRGQQRGAGGGLSCDVGATDPSASAEETKARVTLRRCPEPGQRDQAVIDAAASSLGEAAPSGRRHFLRRDPAVGKRQSSSWGDERLLAQNGLLGSTPQYPLQCHRLTWKPSLSHFRVCSCKWGAGQRAGRRES